MRWPGLSWLRTFASALTLQENSFQGPLYGPYAHHVAAGIQKCCSQLVALGRSYHDADFLRLTFDDRAASHCCLFDRCREVVDYDLQPVTIRHDILESTRS